MKRKNETGLASPVSLLISGARVLDPASGLDAVGHVGIRDGLIAYVGRKLPAEKFAATLNAKHLWLMPGIVDLCARLREPGATQKATIRSEAQAAHAGGITTLCIPPDTRPVIDTPSVVDRVLSRAARAGGLDVRVLGALTQNLAGEALPDMAALAAAGVSGVSNAFASLSNLLIARRALEYARGCGLTVHVLPQEHALAAGGCAHEGPVATRLGLPGIPTAAETVAIAQWLALVEETGARLHFGRLSSARGVEMIEQAQQRGLPVSADVAAHQLFLTEDDLLNYNASSHLIPPLRAKADREALRNAVKKGVVSAICSDHQPHEADAKINPFPLTEPGVSALETLLPLALRLVHEQLLSPLQMAARLCSGPAVILNNAQNISSGSLAKGQIAHLLLLDPEARWTLRSAGMVSAGRCTPFDGLTFCGRVRHTLYAGQTVYRR